MGCISKPSWSGGSGDGGNGGSSGGPNFSGRDPFADAARQLTDEQRARANKFFIGGTVSNLNSFEYHRDFGANDVTVRGFSPSNDPNPKGIGKRYEVTIRPGGSTRDNNGNPTFNRWTVPHQ